MVVIEFKNVSKSFKIFKNKSYSIKEKFIGKLLRRAPLEVEEYPVLTDVSFKINKGETVGIIGQNGTGKSTTLKLISKILYQDKGEVTTNGSISALLEVGAGFQQDLTGRENVFLYGSILGLSKKEISDKYDEIVEFSELRDFMNNPVKNYSSGMYMRLAFSVAIHVNPDILVIDEVLAVGDAAFQKKCINKILSFKEQQKTIVFVSHDMSAVKKICDRVFFIKKGGEMIEGTPDEMIDLYYRIGNQ
ncbi:ABC transporter ATP-binding protein [Clostridium cellulovorans]|uniref:ABC transporter related n=1 Tax=Clostridium cellulovorans (strain ATCC 35296 / DSM 3052 / OCM 3 / 743B) TaxID=573061 RepID=D9SRL3_CLOC7|nr:ABC transporter ATP-binding protein [Clostridium cellulovorans]ADL50380.1 ABC transporter related [Clostridium cellulovorans 743B]